MREHLDSIFHQPGWEDLPVEEFRRQVSAATAAGGWVVDGNYSAVQDLVWERADTVVWRARCVQESLDGGSPWCALDAVLDRLGGP